MNKGKYVTARVPQKMHDHLQKLADKRYTTISQIVRQAIAAYLEKEDPR